MLLFQQPRLQLDRQCNSLRNPCKSLYQTSIRRRHRPRHCSSLFFRRCIYFVEYYFTRGISYNWKYNTTHAVHYAHYLNIILDPLQWTVEKRDSFCRNKNTGWEFVKNLEDCARFCKGWRTVFFTYRSSNKVCACCDTPPDLESSSGVSTYKLVGMYIFPRCFSYRSHYTAKIIIIGVLNLMFYIL